MTQCPECGTFMHLDGANSRNARYICPKCENMRYVDPHRNQTLGSYRLECPKCGRSFIEGSSVDTTYSATKASRMNYSKDLSRNPKAFKAATCPKCSKKLIVRLLED